ncbi:MAG: helix-turn-helix domain-containing protein [Dysosmobacter sp.]
MSFHTALTLYALDQDGGCTQKQIAENWMIPKQTVNTVVKDLERRGYVSLRAGRDQKEKLVLYPGGTGLCRPVSPGDL